jgi:RNA recognition motif-containing protein
VRIVRDQVEGDCKGFGFVEYREGSGAERAVRELHGASRLGSKLKVRYAADKAKP